MDGVVIAGQLFQRIYFILPHVVCQAWNIDLVLSLASVTDYLSQALSS